MRRSLIRAGLSATLSPVRLRFGHAVQQPARAQERVRRRITAALARTEYGSHCGLDGREDYARFAARVPIVDFEDIEPWIERQMQSRANVLTPEPIVAYEETSGSSARRKCIPYTPSLLGAFNKAFVTWAADVIAHGPRLQTGRMFFSLSPACRAPRHTATGVPIGLQDDTQYLTPIVRRFVGRQLVVPPGMAMVLGPVDFRRVLLCRLIAAVDLEVISIWSPTYLLALMDLMKRERETILRALAHGFVETGGGQVPVPRLPVRSLTRLEIPMLDWATVWPELKLISVWTDAGSAPFARKLEAMFPQVLVQGKGLLSTEAPVTIPLFGAEAPVPMVDRVFLEFERDDGSVVRLSDLADREEVGVIVSQTGGLVRYRTHDRVRVEGRHRETPCLRFVGRDNLIHDFVGEKLHGRFVETAIQDVFGADVFGLMVPVSDVDGRPGYRCLVERADEGAHEAWEHALDVRLCEAVHYRQARLHGQLAPVEMIVMPDLRARYERLMLDRGMVLGEIKYSALLRSEEGDPLVAR
jgi:hypothetical protein